MKTERRSEAETRFAAHLTQGSETTSADAEQNALREKTARLRALRLARDSQVAMERTLRLQAKRRHKDGA